jgi:subtilisin family serine protease
MKQHVSTSIISILFGISILFAGGSTPPTLDPYNPSYTDGVVLVKFQDGVSIDKSRTRQSNPQFGVVIIDSILSALDVFKIGKIFHQNEKRIIPLMVKMPTGMKEAPELHQVYRVEFSTQIDAKDIAEQLSQLAEVEYAEPDYQFRIMETIPDDPLFNEQWYFAKVNAPAMWDSTTSDSSQVLGIIDTGVDWDHPDLANNIWINEVELNGADGVDDDNNGYVDDIRGWDWVSMDNNPDDDNSHGTHVAGIAAGVSNNGVGISGMAWNARIMPLKVLQSTGYGTSSDIAAAVEYAHENGATVINLSLGGFGYSETLKQALEVAYSTSIEVAAAGNNGLCIGPGQCPDNRFGAPFFPGAFSWVIGVQATQQNDVLTGFSNFDQDGPTTSQYSEGYNYEIKAPGSAIHSTFPNGNYHSLNGTSMAAPVVAGGIATLLSYRTPSSTEILRAQLIDNTSANIDFFAMLTADEPAPILSYVSHTIVDTCDVCDDDGNVDAGETVEIWFTIKNYGGFADSVTIELDFAEFEDTTTAIISTNISFVGDISAYGQLSNEANPLVVHFDDDLANNRQIGFTVRVEDNENVGVNVDFAVLIQSGTELSGVMDTTLILTDDKLYLVNSSFKVGENGILQINPGVHIILNEKISNLGQINALGTKENRIIIDGPYSIETGTVNMNFVTFNNIEYTFDELCGTFSNCIFTGFNVGYPGLFDVGVWNSCGTILFTDCQFINGMTNPLSSWATEDYAIFIRCNFDNIICGFPDGTLFYYGLHSVQQCNFSSIESTGNSIGLYSLQNIYHPRSQFYQNNILTRTNSPVYGAGAGSIDSIAPQYWGTLDDDIIEEYGIYDFYDDASLAEVIFTNKLLEPADSTHGIVWKVLVNGVDPQDENLDDLGPGTHQFDVYFNRAMVTSFEPFLTFGVAEPYTQHVVTDSASWSADSSIWTAYYTMGLETGDGINQIRVSGAKDTDDFPIPIERKRFKFTLQAAGAASVEFIATPGIGKVDLEWPPVDTDDLLGYNMYRQEQVNDSTWLEFNRMNSNLITDSTYTDFAIIPDTTYKYYYTVIGTDFAESDPSKVITTTPFSAANGDANGDLTVDVLDIISIVNYMLQNDPEPFLFDAADINGDDYINVLDIISVVNILVGGNRDMADNATEASFTIQDDQVWLSSNGDIGGYQFILNGNVDDLTITSLYPMEVSTNQLSGNELFVAVYSLTQNSIPEGNHPILTLSNSEGITFDELIVSDTEGNAVNTILSADNEQVIPDEYSLGNNYPNPFNGTTRIKYSIPEVADLSFRIYNILGQEIFRSEQKMVKPGYYSFVWHGQNTFGENVASGIYLYQMKTEGFISHKKMLYLK